MTTSVRPAAPTAGEPGAGLGWPESPDDPVHGSGPGPGLGWPDIDDPTGPDSVPPLRSHEEIR